MDILKKYVYVAINNQAIYNTTLKAIITTTKSYFFFYFYLPKETLHVYIYIDKYM